MCSCGGGGATVSTGPTPPDPPVATPNYQQNVSLTSAWLSTQQLSDGAILYTSDKINPYFANLAAIGWLKDPNKIAQVQAWMQWYLDHLNSPDYNGLNGTIYDYTVSGGVEAPANTYDSVDSYSATFLSLAEALWNTGDSGAQTFIRGIGESKFQTIANTITGLQQSNGLVLAKPDYPIEYLMDNSEDFRGLMDFASLSEQAWGDAATANSYQAYATSIQSGIQNVLFIPAMGLYYTSAGAASPNLAHWYPDAVAQLYPIVNGVIESSSSQATTLYSKFNTAWPGWTTLSFNSQDSFPWCVVGYTSYLMGDSTRANKYLNAIQNKYVSATPAFPWPFYVSEAGWFMRTNAAMVQH